MEECPGSDGGIRVLGLGSELLADDAFGLLVAEEVRRRVPHGIDVACSSSAGFGLMDDLVGVSRLVVVDTVATGTGVPGTIHVFSADRVRPATCPAPHFLGLFEVLEVAGKLGLSVPRETLVIAVEASDCTTIGGAMHAGVRAAIPAAACLVQQFIDDA